MMKVSKYIQIVRTVIQAFFMTTLFFSFLPRYNIVGKLLFYTILVCGVFFCGWVCPFGAIQDWLLKIARKLKIPRYQVPKFIQQYLVISRYGFYVLGTAGIVLTAINARKIFNHQLFEGLITVTSGIVLVLFLITSLLIDRPFCNYFCTKGAFFGLVGVVRIFGIRRDNTKCIHCKACDRNCPMNIEIEKRDFVRHPNCINCMTCLSRCPRQCISYNVIKLSETTERGRGRPTQTPARPQAVEKPKRKVEDIDSFLS